MAFVYIKARKVAVQYPNTGLFTLPKLIRLGCSVTVSF